MLFKSIFISAFILSAAAHAETFTDEMAIEDGMTPVSEMSMRRSDLFEIMNFNRSEYVSSIPSEEDITKVIQSHKQVIVINKAASGKDAQTLRVYRDGVIKPLFEKTKKEIVAEDGTKTKEEILEEKQFVKISTGREKKENSSSGRKYFSTTPKGFFRPQRVYEMYFSNTWKSDMPNAIFINCSRADFNSECGIAIHATGPSHYAELGKRASGGCLRTKLEVSKQLRELVMETGLGTSQFTLKKESYRRDKVVGNTVVTDLVDRDSGAIVNKKINSWDTVIVIYE